MKKAINRSLATMKELQASETEFREIMNAYSIDWALIQLYAWC